MMGVRQVNILFAFFLALTAVTGCSRLGGMETPAGPSTVSPTVFMDPAAFARNKGSSVTVDVYIENVTDLYYAAFEIVYDPAKVSLPANNWTEGTFLKQGGASTHFIVGSEQALAGTSSLKRTVGISRVGASSGVSGTGVLCSFTFTLSTAGTTSIGFNQDASTWGFMDINNSQITITVGNGLKVNIS